MNVKRLVSLIFPVITLVLEILPFGAVCNFANFEGESIRETFSYFSLIPFGYANFAPFLTALTTCVILVMLVTYTFSGKRIFATISKILLCVAVCLSLCPLIFGISYFSFVGAAISLTLTAELVLVFVTGKS